MSPSPLYQSVIAELESVLSPRVVSRSLKEGMAQAGTTPEALEYQDLERILKGQIYRHLQVAMPAEQAKGTISEILERLRSSGRQGATRDPTPAPLDGQHAALEELQEAMRPFNLYFEWPEVQKLRAQIQLLASEQESGKEAAGLLREAREQLRAVSQKLEDHLVIQARDLGELEGLLEQVRSLGGPKVRRLENLLGQIRDAQQQRQLATAEIERCRKLGTDLRKLLESSVLSQQSEQTAEEGGVLEVEQDEEPVAIVHDDEEGVNARLLMIDLESERHELSSIETLHAHLLDHLPELRERIARLREVLAAGEPVGDELVPLREELEQAAAGLQRELQGELDGIADDAVKFGQHTDTAELSQAVQVAKGVLETSIPTLPDIRRIRDLHALAQERTAEAEKLELEAESERQARLQEQASALSRLEAAVQRYRQGGVEATALEELQGGVAALRAAQDQQELVPELLASLRRSEEKLQTGLNAVDAGAIGSPQSRGHELLRQLESLPLLPAFRERAQALAARLTSLTSAEQGAAEAGASQIEEAESAVAELREELQAAYRDRLRAARREANWLGRKEISARAQQAEAELAQGVFPVLEELEGGLRSAADERLQENMAEIRALELESTRFSGIGLTGYDELSALLKEAKEADQSDTGRLLSRAWLQLEALRGAVEQRLAGIDDRLDVALEILERVEKLNSDDVEESRRILRHLDSQRDSLGRVSLGLRLELESSLQHAEGLLTKLQQEYEATRAIADQLVSGNFVDDMLGLLGGAEPRSSDHEAAPDRIPEFETSREAVETRSGNPKLDAWVERYLAEEGVIEVAILDQQGRLVAGRLTAPSLEARSAVDELFRELGPLGSELGRGAPQVATFESGSKAFIATRLIGKYRFLAVLDAPSGLSRVLHRLRHELAPSEEKMTSGSPLSR